VRGGGHGTIGSSDLGLWLNLYGGEWSVLNIGHSRVVELLVIFVSYVIFLFFFEHFGWYLAEEEREGVVAVRTQSKRERVCGRSGQLNIGTCDHESRCPSVLTSKFNKVLRPPCGVSRVPGHLARLGRAEAGEVGKVDARIFERVERICRCEIHPARKCGMLGAGRSKQVQVATEEVGEDYGSV
jgi:hypothetical protein